MHDQKVSGLATRWHYCRTLPKV